jgi:hypothetical protein
MQPSSCLQAINAPRMTIDEEAIEVACRRLAYKQRPFPLLQTSQMSPTVESTLFYNQCYTSLKRALNFIVMKG